MEFYNYRNRIHPRSYSVSKAVSYAKKYAINFWGNFIMRKLGVIPICLPIIGGVDYKYSSHASFANKLKKGDYISIDYTNDGNWDHMGFVTAVGSKTSSGYKNYQVAQHSGDYLAWANSSKCGWAKTKNNYSKAKFGIVRIS